MVVLPIDDRGLDVQPIMRGRARLRQRGRRPGAPRDDDRGARPGAAHPLRRELRHRGPDPPPPRRAGPARGRRARAPDRRRGRRGGDRPRRARPGGHDRVALVAAGAGPPGAAPPGLGPVRPAGVRHLRLHLAPRRARAPRRRASSCAWRGSA